ncbi:MAG: type II secretion system protein GspG [Candidatus Omnitrophica bacterium]|nr:type II secretion system protein GspG [Candidatus Omnitrophota bacterium]
MKRGLVLIELVIAIVIISILALIASKFLPSVIQISRIARAKTQIANIACFIEMVKDDTGYYPVCLEDCKQHDSPPGINKGWKGPYCNIVPRDPWQTAYFYVIPPTEIYDVPPIIRGYGAPTTYSLSFHVPGGSLNGKIRIENYGVASSTLDINGGTIFGPSYFHNLPASQQPDVFEKDVVFQSGTNSMDITIASGPTKYYIVYLSGYFPTSRYFILGSYGKDGLASGKGFNEDIQWRSDTYPHFIPGI